MGQHSKIEWTDHTFNPWRGCTKVSPGCANCYAEKMSHRNPKLLGVWGPGKPRVRASAKMWAQPMKWNNDSCEGVEEGILLDKDIRRHRVFCASLADWLDDEVPIEWLADLLDLIRKTADLDWLLLTKRPGNWRPRLKAVRDFALHAERYQPELHSWVHAWLDRHDVPPPHNIWIGTSVEDQARGDERVPLLLEIPARIRFLSCEPLLGPVDLRRWTESESFDHSDDCDNEHCSLSGGPEDCVGIVTQYECINWVICGGESGPGARPMHPDWARSLRDQCQATGTPFFFKQWGGVHKAETGRELDGKTWDELPISGVR
jgi:protein gp37